MVVFTTGHHDHRVRAHCDHREVEGMLFEEGEHIVRGGERGAVASRNLVLLVESRLSSIEDSKFSSRVENLILDIQDFFSPILHDDHREHGSNFFTVTFFSSLCVRASTAPRSRHRATPTFHGDQ